MKKQLILLAFFVFLCQSTQLLAVRPSTSPVETTETAPKPADKKEIKKQAQLDKKMQKLERKIEKKMEKAEQKKRSILDEPTFRLGLLCLLAAIACGLLVALSILGGFFGFIGGLLGVAGVVLIILALLGY